MNDEYAVVIKDNPDNNSSIKTGMLGKIMRNVDNGEWVGMLFIDKINGHSQYDESLQSWNLPKSFIKKVTYEQIINHLNGESV